MTTFNLSDIYTSWSSYKGLPFPLNTQQYLIDPDKNKKELLSRYGDKWNERINLITGKENFTGFHGQPIVIPISLTDESERDESKKNIILGSAENGQIMIQPMILVEGSKQIVKTPIAGGSYEGTIKEFINLGDYRVRIFGAVVNRDQRKYPEEQVDILKDLWKKNKALKLECDITDSLFTHIVIESFKLDELRMSPGIQFYEMNCISDSVEDVELLKNDNADS